MTELVRLSCNSCGADLDVGADTRFVTCAHCGARLEVKRTGNAAFTEVLREIQQDTNRIAEDVEALRKHAELDALDREWAARRDAPGDKDGQEPNPTAIVVGTGFAAAFGVVWMAFADRLVGAPLPFTLFGLVFIAAALYGGYRNYHRAADLAKARQEYQRRREELERR